MMCTIEFKYKKLLLRFKQRKFFVEFNKLDDNQKSAYNIANKMITNKLSNLMIAPESNTFYIKTNKIFCKIEMGGILVADDKHFYEIVLPEYIMKLLRTKFSRIAEGRRIRMEKGILDNLKTNLQVISEQLT